MSAPSVPGLRGVARVNPVASLTAALVLAACLVTTIDVVSAAVALALELLLAPLLRLPARTFWMRAAPVLIAAPLAGLTIALYGRASGEVHLEFLLVRVSDGSLELALATALRVLAIGLPAVLLFATVDATALADGLAQLVRLPARFVLGALAALRLVELFGDDWRSLELARRARGVADRGRVRRLLGQVFALLVLSLRRGTALATAMEARGFGGGPRTWARRSRWAVAEWMVVASALGVGLVAIAAAVVSGEFNALLG